MGHRAKSLAQSETRKTAQEATPRTKSDGAHTAPMGRAYMLDEELHKKSLFSLGAPVFMAHK